MGFLAGGRMHEPELNLKREFRRTVRSTLRFVHSAGFAGEAWTRRGAGERSSSRWLFLGQLPSVTNPAGMRSLFDVLPLHSACARACHQVRTEVVEVSLQSSYSSKRSSQSQSPMPRRAMGDVRTPIRRLGSSSLVTLQPAMAP